MRPQRTKILCVCLRCGDGFPKPIRGRPQTFCSRPCADSYHRRPLADRFWDHVRKSDGCWTWTGSLGTHGYGQLATGSGRQTHAHRAAWELIHGPIPPGLFVCHHCDNRSCVRNDGKNSHLFLGTARDNSQDMVKKGRSSKGRKRFYRGNLHGMSKLTEDDVREIRRLRAQGLGARRIVRIIGKVDRTSIERVIYGKTWTHVA